MLYSMHLGASDISHYVVGIGEVVLFDATYDGQITLPALDVTVINNAQTYAVDDAITLEQGGYIIYRYVIESIDVDIEAGTKTLHLVDAMKLLERHYLVDLAGTDYSNAVIAYPSEDFDGVDNIRYYTAAASTPYRRRFVTLTHWLKMCAVKVFSMDPADIDMSAIYGELESGFYWWNNSTDEAVPVLYEELVFHPAQLKYIGKDKTTDPIYEGGTWLDAFLLALWVLNAEYRYHKDGMVFWIRDTGSGALPDNAKYQVKVDGFGNRFDALKIGVVYVNTRDQVGGFTDYVDGVISTEEDIETESWSYPEITAPTTRPKVKSVTLPRHAIVHRRAVAEYPVMQELHYNAAELGTDEYQYYFAWQFAKLISERYPALGGVVDEVVTSDANLYPATARIALKRAINVEDQTVRIEW